MPEAVEEQIEAEVVLPAPEGQAAEPTEPQEEIQIGERTFKTQAEAVAYAQSALRQKEQELAVVEAYNAGLVERGGAAPQAQPAAAPPPDNWEERFYANPRGTLQELREEIKKEVLGSVAGQTEDDKMWAEFNRRHPDLDGFKEDVSSVLTRYDREIRALASTKGKEQAMDFLAQKTRAKFEDYNERKKPSRTLPNGSGGSPPSTQTNVTNKSNKKEETPLSFIDQIRQNKAKRMS